MGWEIGPDDIHVWIVEQTLAPEISELCLEMLSAEEQQRRARIRIGSKRLQFASSRAILRRLLSFYLHCDSRSLGFAYNQNGKPYLRDMELTFNIAHSESMMVAAIARNRDVGIDVERIGSKSQQAAGPPGEWTRREAYVKARGWALPLEAFDFEPGWTVRALEHLGPGYAGALAAWGDCWRVESRTVSAPALLSAPSASALSRLAHE